MRGRIKFCRKLSIRAAEIPGLLMVLLALQLLPGSAYAQNNLAQTNAVQTRVVQDDAAADPAAQEEHGGYDDSSSQLSPDAMPLTLLLQQAESGDSQAQFELGTRYLAGSGVTQDNFAAANWFRQAAAQGNHNAQYNLGVMSLNGMGVIADFDEALRWFHEAAENADSTAQFTLGVIYANGRGVPQDLAAAHMWFSLAAAGGEQSAAINALLFQEMLSPEQLAESQREAQIRIDRFNRNLRVIP